MKKLLVLLLTVVLFVTLLPSALMTEVAAGGTPDDFFCVPATSVSEDLTPVTGITIDGQNYATWAKPVQNNLSAYGDGFMLLSCYNGGLKVQYYDKNFCLLSEKGVSLPLPLFGGVYICDDYNFVVCGQSNYAESNSTEVFRVIRYSKNWDNPVHCSLFGANTTIPFDAGSLRFARSGNNLYIRTCHEMYTSPKDGLNHQANVTMLVNVKNMTMQDSLTAVSNQNRGYVSHSFNQFILVDGKNVVGLDHGDYYPRSILLSKYKSASSISGKAETVDALTIADNTGHYNSTGVSIGGFEYSDSSYLVAGNSCSQTGGINQGKAQRNIFVSAVNKSSFSKGKVTWITNYSSDSKVEITTPHFVKLSSSKFMLLWGIKNTDTVYYCTVDGTGKLISEIQSVKAHLSDCPPIYVDGEVLWVYSKYNQTYFCRLSLEHTYLKAAGHLDCEVGGTFSYMCFVCGKSFTETRPATAHEFGEWKLTIAPTEESVGEEQRACANCGKTETRTVDALVHIHDYIPSITHPSCTDGGYTVYTCRCGDSYTDDYVSAIGHTEVVDKAIESTCTATGLTEGKHCSVCNEILVAQEVIAATGHAWAEWVTTVKPTADTEGEAERKCEVCSEIEKNTLPKVAYKLGDVNGDGKLNAKDATAILKYIVGKLEDPIENFELIADVNGDTKVNAKDATKILKTIVDKDFIEGWE